MVGRKKKKENPKEGDLTLLSPTQRPAALVRHQVSIKLSEEEEGKEESDKREKGMKTEKNRICKKTCSRSGRFGRALFDG